MGMAVIKAECLDCGPVRLQPADLTVRTHRDAADGTYRFRCPRCGEIVCHDATGAVCDLLVGSGVAREIWDWPAELAERPGGPSLTTDDLLDFHLLLEHDADVAASLERLAVSGLGRDAAA
jgi:hypothetical protein